MRPSKKALSVSIFLMIPHSNLNVDSTNGKPAKGESDHITRILCLITPKILERSNSFLFVVYKKIINEYMELIS